MEFQNPSGPPNDFFITMIRISEKINVDFKRVAKTACIFLAISAILIYLANFDTKAYFRKAAAVQSSFAGTIDLNDPDIGDSDKDGLSDHLEYTHGTNALKIDTDGDGYDDMKEIRNGYDPDAPGDTRPSIEIAIAKINISAPMVWSASDNEKSQLVDLKNGVSHFPGSAAPGQSGNMIISGHSSNYVWVKGNYNYVFKNLNKLEIGDFIDVKVFQQNGRIITYHYKVSEKFVSAPDEEKIFQNSEKSSLSLSTCWPLGTNFRRLIVKAERNI